jgi:predicted RNA-binding protein Jag
MAEKTIEVEADTLEEAREQLKSQVPKGFSVLTEQIISDGKHQIAKASGDTTEAALAKAKSNIPNNADILEQKELSAPEQKVITLEAFDENIARSRARASQISKGEVIKSIKVVTPGSKGFLGIGKRPNQYKIEIIREAVVEITYKTKAKISTKIRKLEQQEITMLVQDIKNIWKGERDQQAAANKLIREGAELAIEPLKELLIDKEILVREIAIKSLSSISTELPKTDIKWLEQATDKYEKDLDTIKQQIEPLVVLLEPLAQWGSNQGHKAYQQTEAKIKQIGENINKIGGHSAMWIPFTAISSQYKYPPLGSILESKWDGIGTWRR